MGYADDIDLMGCSDRDLVEASGLLKDEAAAVRLPVNFSNPKYIMTMGSGNRPNNRCTVGMAAKTSRTVILQDGAPKIIAEVVIGNCVIDCRMLLIAQHPSNNNNNSKIRINKLFHTNW